MMQRERKLLCGTLLLVPLFLSAGGGKAQEHRKNHTQKDCLFDFFMSFSFLLKAFLFSLFHSITQIILNHLYFTMITHYCKYISCFS